MDQKELKIIPPEGFEVDKENSTFECIKFKPKRWRDDTDAEVSGYLIPPSCIITSVKGMYNTSTAYDVYASFKQAKSALAMARISQIMANDKRFGKVITDEEWNNETLKFVINRSGKYICKECFTYYHHFLAFHTEQQRDLFLQENEDLVRDYLML